MFILSPTVQTGYNDMRPEERCSVASNVRLRANQQTITNGARTLFS